MLEIAIPRQETYGVLQLLAFGAVYKPIIITLAPMIA